MAQQRNSATSNQATPATTTEATPPAVADETQGHRDPQGKTDASFEDRLREIGSEPQSKSVVPDDRGLAYDEPALPPGFGDRVLHACLSPALGELRVFDQESIRTRARNAVALVLGADAVVRECLDGHRPGYVSR